MSRTRTAAAITIATLALSACSFLSEKSVPKEDLEQGVRQLLEEQVDEPVSSVTCDDDLSGEIDSEVRCTLEATDGTTIGLTVTATAIDGDNVEYSIVVDEESQPSGGSPSATPT